jgi:hypothetical protein
VLFVCEDDPLPELAEFAALADVAGVVFVVFAGFVVAEYPMLLPLLSVWTAVTVRPSESLSPTFTLFGDT